jgi:hypothetical protein
MIKITGLDELQKTLSDAAEALKALDGQLATLKFNPNDPSSVEAAVIEMEQTIDTKIAPYRGNSIVENLVSQLKKRYQQEIYDRAAKARLQGGAS